MDNTRTYTVQKFGDCMMFFNVSSAHQRFIYLVKNTYKWEYCDILLLFKITTFY